MTIRRLLSWFLLATSTPSTLSPSSTPVPYSVSTPNGVSLAPDSRASMTTTSSLATETGPTTTPQYPFSPYPTPTFSPLPPLFPETDPSNPPSVSPNPAIIPDFAPAWSAAYTKAKAMISNFTLEQKVNITTGVGWMNGTCVGNTHPVGDFPGLCLQDSPLGVRLTDLVSAFPAGITTASTWNRTLIRARALAIGEENRAKGVNIVLGPGMNMARIPQRGRNFEGSGADPFLTGEAAYETILGIQAAGVQATAKHFIDNEQEWQRYTDSSIVDDRTQHEIYAHPFLRSVMAGVSSVMCSYNLVNATYACNNNKTLNDILKREFGFQGFVQSDWFATMTTLSAVAGLDMTMPGDITPGSGDSYFGGNLTAYVTNNTISMDRLDDMATRIVAAWYFVHQDEGYPKTTINSFDAYDPINQEVDAQSNHYEIVRQVAAAGIVLLKNEGTLPLKKHKSVVLVGSDAAPAVTGPNVYPDQAGDLSGILAMGWGSGTCNFTYLVSPYEAIQARARVDHTTVSWHFNDWDLAMAGDSVIGKEVAIVFVKADSGEGYMTVDGNPGDRRNLTAWHQGDQLVLAVAAQNNNTIVVTNSVGPLILEPWVEHPNVTAIVWANLGGNEAGNGIMDVLYGNWNPSGRLPYTIAKSPSDYPAKWINDTADDAVSVNDTEGLFVDHVWFDPKNIDPRSEFGLGYAPSDDSNGSVTVFSPQDTIAQIPFDYHVSTINYTEGLFIDYRWFDAKNITPRYEFGFGLSYTTFEYSNLAVKAIASKDTAESDLITNWQNGGASPIAQGSSTALWLHIPAYQVTFNVKNTGSVYGGEIPQLYLHHPSSANEPPSILKGFTNIELKPGKTGKATITLSRYDLSVWDVVRQGWAKPNGTIGFSIGASSRDFRLSGVIPAGQTSQAVSMTRFLFGKAEMACVLAFSLAFLL